MKRKAWLVLAVVPVLIAIYAIKKSSAPAPVSGGDTRESQSAMTSVPVAAAPREQSTITGNLDPFAVLDRRYDEQRTAETARFDQEAAAIKARIQPALEAADAKYQLNVATLNQPNLDPGQKMQRLSQFNVQHEKTRLEIKRTIQADLDELTAKRTEVLAKLESDRAAKRTRLEELQAKAESGQITPIAAKRSQFEFLGIDLPLSAFQPPDAAEDRQGQNGTKDAPPKNSTPKVEAVITGADNRLCALIGDALVEEGATVRGYRVQKISPDTVEFQKDGKTWVQKVN